MKKITFLAFAILLVAASAKAEKREFRFDEPIAFLERGIMFYVFPNGEFDFNAEPTSENDFYYRGNQNNNSYANARPVRIEHDAQGRVRRIGNVFVNYDNANRIKRIGSVYMSYYRSALTQVGGLRLIYDRRGQLIDLVGSVKGRGQYAYQYQPATYYGPSHFNQNDYYYYKADGTKAPIKEQEMPRK